MATDTASPRRGARARPYTLILTETTGGGIQETIPALPACRVEAATRDKPFAWRARLLRRSSAGVRSSTAICRSNPGRRHRLVGSPRHGAGRPRPTPQGRPCLMIVSSAVRPHGMWPSPHVSLGRPYPPHQGAGPCAMALVSPTCPVGRDGPPLGRCRRAPRTVRLCAEDPPAEAPLAHQRVLDTQQMRSQFPVVVCDAVCATVMACLRQPQHRRKRYADRMRAARVVAGQYVLVTRHQADCRGGLPQAPVAHGMAAPPEAALPGELTRRASP